MTFKKVSCEPLHLHAHHKNNNGEDRPHRCCFREEGGGGRHRRMAVLPLGSFLPISCGKALVQTETRVVSNTRREQTGGGST